MLLQELKEAQRRDGKMRKYWKEVDNNQQTEYNVRNDGLLCFKGRVCVLNEPEMLEKLLKEAQHNTFNIHPGSTKMYSDLKRDFWWHGMKNDIARYVSHWLTCQKIKTEHQIPAGYLQSLDIPQWKWKSVSMDFVVGLPVTRSKKRRNMGDR